MPPPYSLPPQLSSFIGRDREIADVKRLLGTSRLLTLTGAGGTGKTRLALQVASQVVDEYPDGVYFVNLAPIIDHSLVVPSIALTLDVKEATGQPPIETLKAYLKDKEMLLLLDNFEQVLQAALSVMDLLLAAPDLKVMVTSREPLHLRGEQQYQVPPLELPNPKQPSSVEELSQNEAVALFSERARSARPDFDLTEKYVHTVAEICSRLDGLPLAIELAAARIHVLTPLEILSRLESRLNLLTGGAHDVPTRQQTLRNTIEWSYDLLPEGEKQLLRRMSVFQGGHNVEALEAVCNSEGLQIYGSPEVEMLEGLFALVDKNLLQRREDHTGDVRFAMLETINEFAREKLQESGEAEDLYRQHAFYFMRMAEEAEPHLTGAQQASWLNRLEDEHDDFLTALRWTKAAAETRARGAAGTVEALEAAEIGLRIAGSIWRFWETRGYLSVGREQLMAMLTHQASIGAPALDRVKAKVLHGIGSLSYRQGDYSTSRSHYERALMLNREIGDVPGVARSLNNLGLVAYVQGDYATARALYEESLAIYRRSGDRWGIAVVLNNLGNAAFVQGDYDTAHSRHAESLEIRRAMGNKTGIAWSLNNLGNAALGRGDYDTARTFYAESIAVHYELRDITGIAASVSGLGASAVGTGHAVLGARLLGASEAFLRAIGATFEPDDRIPYELGLASARALLGEGAFEKAQQEGRDMDVEAAIAHALEALPEIRPLIRVETASKESRKPKPIYPNGLSRREIDVLRLLAEGLTNEQLAERLFLSTNTVRAHLYSVYNKLNVSNRGSALRVAHERQLI